MLYAISGNKEGMEMMIKSKEAKVNATDNLGRTILHFISTSDRDGELVEYVT